ncbi:MAG: isoprenylcysteine carboxylmethyltransferase family protein [Vicinamibacterales bacterium]
MPESSHFAERLARWRVPLGFACGGAVLYLARPTPPALALGGVVALAGQMIRIWAAGHLDKGREVTQSGPYRFTRHPLYLGSGIVAAGVAVASGTVSVAIIVGVYMGSTIAAAVRHEEENMRSRFGDGYDAYLQSRAAPVQRAFSLHRAMTVNKEYKAVAGLLAFALIMAAKVFLEAD